MPWERVDVSEQRVAFVVRAVSGKEPLATLCRQFGISRPTGYLWRDRYKQGHHSLLQVREYSRRPHRSPTRTESAKEQQVVALRNQTGWGAKKLQVLLRENNAPLPVSTIHRILQRHGLVKEDRGPGAAPGRFQRAAPNELWQMDSKGEYRMTEGCCHPLSIVDDHSRYAVGLHALPELTAECAYPCVVTTLRCYGVPEAMLMDRGALWWSSTNGWGLTWLSVRLIEQGIRLIYGRVRHPQTQGKVERFHRTLKEALRHRGEPACWTEWPPALAEFRECYNEVRPHEALGMQRPAERYRRSARGYQERPAEWEYPAGSQTQRLNTQGCLDSGGRRWFVCEALAHQRVRMERFDGKLLVSYRHMYIREIDLEGGCSRALVIARAERVGNEEQAEVAPQGARRATEGVTSAEKKHEEKENCEV